MPLPLLVPLPKMSLGGGFYPQIAVLKRLLNEILLLDPPLIVSEKWDDETQNAYLKFKSLYFAKYKQSIADYGLLDEELFVALGKELKEANRNKVSSLNQRLKRPAMDSNFDGKDL